jgi:flavin-dependent dehydrogenase
VSYDVVVVGARCAGSAAATALARAGRRVVALDRVSFPADTISTHLLWPSGLAELQELGALERVRALGAPPLTEAVAGMHGLTIRTGFSSGHAMCVRRTGMDAVLVDTARGAGAEVREGARVTDLLSEHGRVAGVVADGEELRAPLVIGADGRRSTVARAVGAEQPYRATPSGRACFYGYWEDRDDAWRSIAAQWREGGELGTAFPCDDGLVLVLLQPPAARAGAFRADLAGEYARTVAAIPELAARLDGCRLASKVRAATDIASYFRRSSGPGWALAGDAGHFKDPVTAQGIRDALRYGRRLGELVAPVLEDPVGLDRVLRAWEREREQDCIEVYQWTNILARGDAPTPLEVELYRRAAGDPQLAQSFLDVFARSQRPGEVLTARRVLALTARALARRGGGRAATLASARREVATAAADWRERRLVLTG